MKNLSSFWLSVSSISIVLLLIGMFCLTSFHTNSITDNIKENIDIIVEINPGSLDSSIDSLKYSLSQLPEIITNSISVRDEQEAYELMRTELNDLWVLDSISNPFGKVIVFNCEPQFYKIESLRSLKSRIETYQIVSGLHYQNITFEELEENISKMSFYLFLVSLFFILLSIFLIVNNIKLLLMSDQKKIKTMQLVGAESNFILFPYLRKALYIGLISFVVSIAVLSLIIMFLNSISITIADILLFKYVIISALIVLLLSISIPMISTYYIVNLYLRNNHNIYQ